jgi:hypothetical protein
MVASMVPHEAPALAAAFAPVVATLGTAAESAMVRAVYRGIPPSSFSDDILVHAVPPAVRA